MCLTGLLMYDAFWVFGSPQLFGSNVMVTVAQQQASNPAYTGETHIYCMHLSCECDVGPSLCQLCKHCPSACKTSRFRQRNSRYRRYCLLEAVIINA